MWKRVLRSSIACVILLAAPGISEAAQAKRKPTAAKAAAAEGHIVRAMALSQAGQPAQALAEAQAAVRANPRSAKALTTRGFILAEAGDKDGALTDFAAAKVLDPRDVRNYAAAALIYADRKDFPQALAAINALLEIEPANPLAQIMHVSLLQSSGDKAQAVQRAQAYAAMHPDSVPTAQVLAEAYTHNDQHDKAIEVVRATVAKSPDNAELQDDLAQRLLECKDKTVPCPAQRAEAVEVFGKAIALTPTADLYIDRAQARPLSDRDGKFADLNAALVLEPASQFAILARGATYFNYKELEKALVDVDAALAIDPTDVEALALRARIYDGQGKVDAQLQDLDALTALLPDNVQHLNNACWLRATHKRELDRALAQCNAALKIDASNRVTLDSRALVHLQMGNWDEALADYNAAMPQQSYAVALYGRGIAKLRKGMKKEGKADLTSAKKLDKGIAKTFAGYGITRKPKKK
ncbi:tetratricopeptide repeat protein [Asticcacaulis sp. AC402]|uniref:tetratricopeptide repeat protein n=1 Tax=Asticcacaulis sp. AC402 TaxID=1282361 RepID=UPI0004265BEA|nr:tetratricopeptide repeat protein [Asticcacaulis sp. AC402]